MIRSAVLALLVAATLSACSNGIDNSKLRVDIVEDRPRPIAIGALPLPTASGYLRAATAQGLVGYDMQGRVVPDLASRWIVTDDALSYIFRLNKIRWNDGREITSEEVAQLLNTRFAELHTSRFGPDLAVVDRAVSMTGKVVEIRLKAPMPNLLEMIAQPEFGIVRRGYGSGPMQARKLGQALQLRLKTQNEKGETALDDATVALRSTSAALALALFDAGESDLVSGGRFEDYPLVDAAKIDGNEVRIDAVPGLFGLIVANDGPFLSAASNREAIAMAIDRPRMLTSFDVVSWQETVTLSPEGLTNRGNVARPDWAQLRMNDRIVQARDTITRWKSANGAVRPLQIALPRGPGARILFALLRRDLAAIGLDAERVTLDKPADLLLVDRVADLSTPAWYLGQLSCGASPICSADADALVAEARMSADPTRRMQLLAEAEVELQAKRNFIPIANPMRWSVAHPQLLGFAPNPRGWHMLQYLGREPT